MIFVHDKGGLGNNLLQYGHLYAWCREHGRSCMSMRFAYKHQYFHICHTRYHNIITYAFAKYAAKLGLLPIVQFMWGDQEPEKRVIKEQELMSHRSLVVTGWEARWYELFIKYKTEIIQLFAFDQTIEQSVSHLLPTTPRLLLGVHVRRGNYADFYNGRFFYSDEQYLKIIRDFRNIHPNESLTIYICSNDSHLNRNFYQQQLNDCKIVFAEGNPGQDLCLLSHCHYLIGAPSTFTLVAAMYCDLPLYWIEDPNLQVREDSFKKFDYLFQHIY